MTDEEERQYLQWARNLRTLFNYELTPGRAFALVSGQRLHDAINPIKSGQPLWNFFDPQPMELTWAAQDARMRLEGNCNPVRWVVTNPRTTEEMSVTASTWPEALQNAIKSWLPLWQADSSQLPVTALVVRRVERPVVKLANPGAIGKLIPDLLAACSYERYKLAELVGLTEPQLAELEAGRSEVTPELVERIQETCDVTFSFDQAPGT